MALESQVGSEPPRWFGNIPNGVLQHVGMGGVAMLLSWLFFSDVTNLRLDSHDIETFRDHTAIGSDISLLFSTELELRSGRPASELVKWLVYLLFGNDARAFHLFNIGLHGLVSLSLPAMFRGWGGNRLVSIAAAMLFLTQTAHYEAVYWISAVDYPLALLFGVIAVSTFNRYLHEPRILLLCVFNLAFALGLLSHAGIGSVWLVCLCLARQNGFDWRRCFTTLAPPAMIGIGLMPYLLQVTSRQTSVWSSVENFATNDLSVFAGGVVKTGPWLLSRLLTTAHWMPVPAYRLQTWEPYVGALILVVLLWLGRRDLVARLGVVWVLVTLIPFCLISSDAILPYLPAGPSRYGYFASVGSTLLLTWCCWESCHALRRWHKAGSQKAVFWFAVAGLQISAYFATERTEALSLFTSSRSYHIRGELEDGIRQLRLALERAPEALDVEDTYRRLCVMTMAQGNDAVPVIDEGLRYSPRSATLMAYRVAATSIGRHEPWLSTDETSVAHGPALAQAFHHLGLGCIRQGDLTGASAALRTALRLQPDRQHTRGQLATTLSNLATSLVERGQQEAARAAYREATTVEPNRPEYHANLGALVLAAGEESEAIAAFDRAINLGSTDPTVYWTLARLYLNQGALSEAAKTYETLLLDHAQSLNAEACVQVGMALYELGHSAGAEKAYRLAIDLDPRQASARVNLGWILFLQGRVLDAIRWYEEALLLGPHSVAQFNLGLAWLHLANVPRAEATYALAVERYGPDEAVRIGAVADLVDFAQRQGPEGSAQMLLDRFWPEELQSGSRR